MFHMIICELSFLLMTKREKLLVTNQALIQGRVTCYFWYICFLTSLMQGENWLSSSKRGRVLDPLFWCFDENNIKCVCVCVCINILCSIQSYQLLIKLYVDITRLLPLPHEEPTWMISFQDIEDVTFMKLKLK